MEIEEVKQQADIVEIIGQYTKLTKEGNNKYKGLCPFHEEKHGSFFVYPETKSWYCYGACQTGGDVITFLEKKENLSPKDAVEKIIRDSGIKYENSSIKNILPEQTEIADQTEFYKEAHKYLKDTKYYRGISLKTLNRFNVGFVKNWTNPNPNAKKAPASPRLIIPISNISYLARETRSNEELTEKQRQYLKIKVGSQKDIFNGSSLKDAKDYIFVTEGEIDALSIIDQGYNAITAGSVSNINNLYDLIKRVNNKDIVYYLFLDNDETGKKASEKLCEMMKRDGFIYHCPEQIIIEKVKDEEENSQVSIDRLSFKDANEWLLSDKESFVAFLKRLASSEYIENIKKFYETERDAAIEEGISYRRKAAAYLAGDLLNQVMREANDPITTGYTRLNHLMDGGFYEGLYVLGADTGVGKTTLVMQIAESIAKSGKDVLIIALEMSSRDLIARSISRITFEGSLESGHNENARPYRDILRAKQLERLTLDQYDAINTAIANYQTYADHIFIIEGIGDIDANKIIEYTKEHEKQTGKAPVVILDYLQILAPINVRYSDKQNVDASIVSLKRLSRDHHTPVICISSLNRDTNRQNKEGKTEEIAKTGYKESGAIEYAADMLLALGKADFEQPTQEEEENGKPRIMSLKILKARSSRFNVSTLFEYYPKYNYFKELEERTRKSSFYK